MVTSKALKTCFLLLFVVGLSTASSSFQDVTNPNAISPPIVGYYQNPPPDHANEPPAVSYQNPPPVANPPISGILPPIHHPAQKPPTNCDIPPTSGHYNPPPPPPTGYHNAPPSIGGGTGGCNCGDPPSSGPAGPVVAPSPIEQHNPSPAPSSGYHYNPPPSTTTPPLTGDAFPPPSYVPNIPFSTGGTCDFWKKHPNFVSGLLRWWHDTVDQAIGRGNTHGANMNLQEALSNTRTDAIGALYREGTTSLLNSLVNKNFPFTTSHVRDGLLAALVSNEAAAAQAKVFKLANEGRLKQRF